MKECNKCGKLKPLTDYAKNKSDSSGYFRWCKKCWNKARRERYAKNSKPFKLANERYKEKKFSALPCVWCHNPTINKDRIIPGLSKLVPICEKCVFDSTIIGRLNDDEAMAILCLLDSDDLIRLKSMLMGDALNVKMAMEKMNLMTNKEKTK